MYITRSDREKELVERDYKLKTKNDRVVTSDKVGSYIRYLCFKNQ